MSRVLRSAILGAAAVVVTCVAGDSAAQDAGKNPPASVQPKLSASKAERASGVIVKVEPIVNRARKDRDSARGLRLTINTAAVWRDWARDQTTQDVAGSAAQEAAAGANSVATKGEPRTADTLVVVEVGPDGKVETRFRAPDDETSKGGKTPAEARRQDADPAAGGARTSATARDREIGSTRQSAKPTRFMTSDLKPGLFIEVDFRQNPGRNLATSVAVIRPVGAAPVSAKPALK